MSFVSRAIPILLQRKELDDEVTGVSEMEAELLVLRRKLTRWAADHPDLKTDHPVEVTAKDFGSDRRLQVCRCLLAISMDAQWLKHTMGCLLAMFQAAKDYIAKENPGRILLSDVREFFYTLANSHSVRERGVQGRTIVEWLVKLTDRPWSHYEGHGKISERQVADLLREYDIKLGKYYVGKKEHRGYREAYFEKAWRVYLPQYDADNVGELDDQGDFPAQ